VFVQSPNKGGCITKKGEKTVAVLASVKKDIFKNEADKM
jgi:hypothetical protein